MTDIVKLSLFVIGLQDMPGIFAVKATITNIGTSIAYFGCAKCNTKNHEVCDLLLIAFYFV
jgi:hypothetical protein